MAVKESRALDALFGEPDSLMLWIWAKFDASAA
jgi:hypothetical protein